MRLVLISLSLAVGVGLLASLGWPAVVIMATLGVCLWRTC